MKELSQETLKKLKEVIARILEFQDMVTAHEHALQHQAEELLNRATKYDLVLEAARIDDCALKRPTEAVLTALQQKVEWTSEQLSKNGGFGGWGSAGSLGRHQTAPLTNSEAEAEGDASKNLSTVPEIKV